MIIDSKMENQDWLKSFRTKLWKILTTTPIYIDMVLSLDKVELTLPSENKSKTFVIDFEKSIQDNLFDIKTWVVRNWCPKLRKVISIERAPSPEEILTRINENYSDPYMMITEEEVVLTYIEKISPKTSIVIIANEEISHEKAVFKMNYPIVKFLKETKDNSPEERRDFFIEKATFLYLTTSKPQGDH